MTNILMILLIASLLETGSTVCINIYPILVLVVLGLPGTLPDSFMVTKAPPHSRQGPSQHVQFFYARSHFKALRNGHANLSTYFTTILKIKYPSTQIYSFNFVLN